MNNTINGWTGDILALREDISPYAWENVVDRRDIFNSLDSSLRP